MTFAEMAKSKNLIFDIDPKTRCFNVTSHAGNHNGYPSFLHNGKKVRANRYMYELYKGLIPEGLIVRHTCDNPKCVNPDHLILGTEADNYNDSVERNRAVCLPGERNPSAKLTTEIVKEIRASSMTKKSLSKKYGVCRRTIRRIINGESWRHPLSNNANPILSK